MTRLENRLNEIDLILKNYPKCKSGDYLQSIKNKLYSEKRKIKLKLCG